MSKVLVTGGTGFIGSYLVKELLQRGNSVRVFDNNFRGRLENLTEVQEQIELVEGDIRNSDTVQSLVQDIDHVYHLAFINGTEHFYTKPDLVLDVGVRGTMNMIDAVKNSNVSNFIFASSSEIYQSPEQIPTPEEVPGLVPDVKNPRYSYGGGKLMGELLTLHYLKKEMKKVIFRPHNVYGPAMGWKHVVPELIQKIYAASFGLEKKEIELEIQGDGSETRAFCYVDDAVNGIILSAESGADNEVYHVGTQEEVSIRFLIEEIAAALGIQIQIKAGELRAGGTLRRCPDISKLRSLGYAPAVNLQAGLRSTVDWYINELKQGK